MELSICLPAIHQGISKPQIHRHHLHLLRGVWQPGHRIYLHRLVKEPHAMPAGYWRLVFGDEFREGGLEEEVFKMLWV